MFHLKRSDYLIVMPHINVIEMDALLNFNIHIIHNTLLLKTGIFFKTELQLIHQIPTTHPSIYFINGLNIVNELQMCNTDTHTFYRKQIFPWN